jgi:hypothetical protein
MRARRSSRAAGLVTAAGLVCWVAWGTAAVSAASSEPAQASPEALLRTYVAALSRGDEDAAAALVAGRDELSRALDCPTSASPLRDPERYGYRQDVRALARAAKERGVTLSLRALGAEKERETLVPGAAWKEGCKARSPLTFLKVRVDYRVTAGERAPSDEDGDVKLVAIDGRWYFRKPFQPDLGPH